MPANPRTGEKSECPYCKRPFATAYLQTHVRRQHKIYGGLTGRPRRKVSEDFSVPTLHPENGNAPAIVVPTPPAQKPSFKVVDFLVLEDQDGGLWLAERLR